MKRKIKLILFHIAITISLIFFVVMSITIFYLVPIGESVMDYLREAIKELIGYFKK